MVCLSNSIRRLHIKHISGCLRNDTWDFMPPHRKQMRISFSPSPLSLWQMRLHLFPCIYIQTASSKSTKEEPCRFSLQTPKESRTAEVLQAAVCGHTCAALINRHHKASERVNGAYKKAILFVCVFLKSKGQYIELVKQTTAAGLKGALPPAAAQP